MQTNASSILLTASSRPDGNTATIANYLAGLLDAETLDLSAHRIAPYSYSNNYPEDDEFQTIIERLLTIDHWVLVTPVYWYTMSAQLKTFLDRISDLLSYHKSLLPQLTGKTLWGIAVGSESTPTPHFFYPFRQSAEYLGMYYGGDLHTWLGRTPVMKPEVPPLLEAFAKKVRAQK